MPVIARKRRVEDGPLFHPLTDKSPVHDIDDVTPTFKHSAMLRIRGQSLDFERIERELSLAPTHTHRKGDRRNPVSSVVRFEDMWCYEVGVGEEQPLGAHIDALWSDIHCATEYLLSLKDRATVDVFLGYRSDWMDGGVEVPASSLEMFVVLDIPFSLSIIRL